MLCLWAIAVGAQTVYTGKLTDKAGKPVEKASVVLKGEKGNNVAFTRTTADGSFSVKLPEGKTATKITFVHMSYAQLSLDLDKWEQGQSIQLEEKPVEIKEVKVKPELIRMNGDTLTYSVAGFKMPQDRSIEDVIARMPGVTVAPSGQIMYQGQPINHFYVEGMDLMGQKYSQVSKNLNADKVLSVQVLENHQPVKMKRGVVFSEQAALNLVLKDEAKNVWMGLLDIGTGMTLQDCPEWLRDGRLVEMMFGKKKQSLSMYKTNNTGLNISREVRSFDDVRITGLLPQVKSGGNPRNSFNDSHAFATNWLIKPSADDDIRFQVSGLLDKISTESFRETHYIDVDGSLVQTESQHTADRSSEWNAEIKYEHNGSKSHLKNIFSGYIDFNKSTGHTQLNDRLTNTLLKPRRRTISDKFSISRRIGKRHFSLDAEANYSYLPGTLLLYNGTNEELNEKILNSRVQTTLSLFGWKNWNIDLITGWIFNQEKMDVAYNDTTASDSYRQHHLSAIPRVFYLNRKLHFSLLPRLSWLYRGIGDRHDRRLIFEPSANISYDLNIRWSLGAEYAYDYSANGSLGQLTHIPFYRQYNYLSRGTGDFTTAQNHKFSSSIHFRSAPHNLFASLSLNYSHGEDYLYRSLLVDGVYRREQTGEKAQSNSYGLNASVQKRLLWWAANISLSANQLWDNSKYLLAGEVRQQHSRSTSITAHVSISPALLFSIDAYSTMSYQNRELSENQAQSYTHFLHSLSLNIFPGKWKIQWGLNYQHSSDKSVSNYVFSNASARYATKKFDLEFMLDNIFGIDEDRRHFITPISETYIVTRLRPRQFVAKISFNI